MQEGRSREKSSASLGLIDDSQVDALGFRCKCVNFGADLIQEQFFVQEAGSENYYTKDQIV